ncbi:uncharacterized protein TM35_000471100 [Trypanosoma theileri]|uniref:Uncharacterized protein n=1 Tax=Trypanosoma theileri TaxID=67003 RepID=A0A1X0NHK3_9TRYP|nr:uncharacterized protein TM35_000471100 [Trypanosoma theileri]ORC84215.1 hypothetical protein TM35_000471100 [Trypanosoma theileri]
MILMVTTVQTIVLHKLRQVQALTLLLTLHYRTVQPITLTQRTQQITLTLSLHPLRSNQPPPPPQQQQQQQHFLLNSQTTRRVMQTAAAVSSVLCGCVYHY